MIQDHDPLIDTVLFVKDLEVRMSQVPRTVSDQVLRETQALAKRAKVGSGKTHSEISEAFAREGKGGGRFSELLNGKRSATQGLVDMHEQLVAAGYISPLTAIDDFGTTFLDDNRLTRECNWAAEAKKAEAFYRKRNKAAKALHELAEVMREEGDPQSRFFFDFLRNFYLKDIESYGSAADQVTRLADQMASMNAEYIQSSSGWKYSETGAKVVHSEPELMRNPGE